LRARMLVLCLAALAVLGGGTSAVASSSGLVISQVYGGGGNSGATLKNDFIELYNSSSAAIDLTGFSVQYASSTGTTWQRTNLSGSIGPGRHYLVQQAQGAGGTVDLPTPDATGAIAMSATAGKVVLVTTNTTIASGTSCPSGASVVDLVGYGGANCFEGAGPTATLSNTTAALRNGEGRIDTDNNGSDFAVGAPNPRNSGTEPSVDNAPRVSSTTPANNAVEVARDANVTVNFSEPVTATGDWFTVVCSVSSAHTAVATGGPDTFTLDPDTDFAQGESCTVTVKAANIRDNDLIDPPDTMASDFTFTFSTVGFPATIMEIQGAGHRSTFANRRVAGVPGVVTAIRPTSFYMQDSTGDGSNATSDGILVFGVNTSTLTVGALVRVDARVVEFGSGDNLTITELDRATFTVGGPATPIVPTVIGNGGRTQPTLAIEDDASGDLNVPGEGGNVFDPAQDGIDFYESLEGMLVQVNNAAVVNATRSFGEITLLADGGANATGLRTARGGILLSPTDANPERIAVDDEILRDQISPRPGKAMPDMNVGARLTAPVVGPLDYSFENYKIQALAVPAFVESPIVKEVAAEAHPSDLTVATFNVENLTAGDPASKFAQLGSIVVTNLRSPEIIAIEEVQDDNGTANNGNVDASQTWAKLIQAIQNAGGPTYAHRQINPVNNQDGGAPGGNIRVGLLYRTDLPELRFVDRPGGTSTNDTTVVGPKNQPRLTFSPGRLGTASAAFVDTRKPLVGEFFWKDKKVFVVANHFSSKGDDQGIFSRWQPPTNVSEGPRHGQAQIVNDFVDDVLALDKDANVIVLGDINDFEFSRTIEILEGDELTTLMRILPPTERYSYVFEGNSQVLDQILVSDAILRRAPEYDVVHVNAEFADSRQASDHEPQVAYLRPKGTGDDE
jgi:uncharacterized protein